MHVRARLFASLKPADQKDFVSSIENRHDRRGAYVQERRLCSTVYGIYPYVLEVYYSMLYRTGTVPAKACEDEFLSARTDFRERLARPACERRARLAAWQQVFQESWRFKIYEGL